MKKILFLTDMWSPLPTANSICAKNVAGELQRRGWEVYVNAFESEPGQKSETTAGIHAEYTRPSLSRRLLIRSNSATGKRKRAFFRNVGILMNRITRVFFLPQYPIVAPFFTRRWSKRVAAQIQENSIDTIVSVNAPLDSVATAYLVKKKHPGIKWIAYYIDGGSNYGKEQNFLAIKKKLQKKSAKWENKVLSLADKIVIMEGHSDYYRTILNSDNLSRTEVLNVPLFQARVNAREEDTSRRQENEKEIWTYTGTIRGVFYDPTNFLAWFLRYCETHNAELHMYGSTNMEQHLSKMCDGEHIFYHGLIAHDRVDEILQNSDVLVYFRSERLDSVSGKFFEYLMYRKPIVYFGPRDDINWNQLIKYPRGVAIDRDSGIQTGELDEIFNEKCILSNDTLKRIYYTSTPDAFADMIERTEKVH